MVHPGRIALIVKLSLSLAVAATAAIGLASAQDGAEEPAGPSTRGCTERVEGGVVRPKRPDDTVIGPVGWIGLSRNFDPGLQDRGRKHGVDVPSMKALAIVRAGPSVTVAVPEAQRGWMWLDYEPDNTRRTHEVEFRPCPKSDSGEERRAACQHEPYTACRSGLTQFNGGIAVDYDRAPDSGRCARLVVRVEGEPRVRRAFAFGPPRGLCDRSRRSVVLGSPEYTDLAEGWGGARPSRLSNGGAPSGVIDDLHWRDWGRPTARGRGTANVYRPGGGYFPPVRVPLRASRIGRCPGYGARAYKVLRVRQPPWPGGPLGPWTKWSRSRNTCDYAVPDPRYRDDRGPGLCGNVGGGFGRGDQYGVQAYRLGCRRARGLAWATSRRVLRTPGCAQRGCSTASGGFHCRFQRLRRGETSMPDRHPAQRSACRRGSASVSWWLLWPRARASSR